MRLVPRPNSFNLLDFYGFRGHQATRFPPAKFYIGHNSAPKSFQGHSWVVFGPFFGRSAVVIGIIRAFTGHSPAQEGTGERAGHCVLKSISETNEKVPYVYIYIYITYYLYLYLNIDRYMYV